VTRILQIARQHVWAVVGAVVSGVLVIVSNLSGVGWSYDSVDYVAIGQSFAKGRGFLDLIGKPSTVHPPGYSLLIAAGDFLGLSINFTLLAINFVSAIVISTCSYILLDYSIRNRVVVHVAFAFIVFSPGLLWQYSMAWTEPAFVAVELLAVVVALIIAKSWKYFALALLCTFLFYLRYVGPVFSLVILAVSMAVDARSRGMKKAFIYNLLAFCTSMAASYIWLLRNKRIDGTYASSMQPAGGSIFSALRTMLGTLGSWVTAKPFDLVEYKNWTEYPTDARIGAMFVVVLFLSAGFVAVRRICFRGHFVDDSTMHTLLMTLALVVGYSFFSAYRYVHFHRASFDNRVMIPIFVPIVILIAITISFALPRSRRLGSFIFAILLITLGVHARSTVSDSLRFGREGRHNSVRWYQELPLHKFVKTLRRDSAFFSNEMQQLYTVLHVWPINNPWQLDEPRLVPCVHRYAVWYKVSLVTDNEPLSAPLIYEDEIGKVYNLGLCGEDINLVWE